MILFTSGSAGVPRAVLHSCGNHYYNAPASNANLPMTAEDGWLLDLPLHHIAWPDTDRDTLKIDRDRFRRLALDARTGTRSDGADE